jgi:hypothetical protein
MTRAVWSPNPGTAQQSRPGVARRACRAGARGPRPQWLSWRRPNTLVGTSRRRMPWVGAEPRGTSPGRPASCSSPAPSRSCLPRLLPVEQEAGRLPVLLAGLGIERRPHLPPLLEHIVVGDGAVPIAEQGPEVAHEGARRNWFRDHSSARSCRLTQRNRISVCQGTSRKEPSPSTKNCSIRCGSAAAGGGTDNKRFCQLGEIHRFIPTTLFALGAEPYPLDSRQHARTHQKRLVRADTHRIRALSRESSTRSRP